MVVGEAAVDADVRSRRREEVVRLREQRVRRRAQRIDRLHVQHPLLEITRLVLDDLLVHHTRVRIERIRHRRRVAFELTHGRIVRGRLAVDVDRRALRLDVELRACA